MRKISVLALAVALLPHTALAQNYNRVITFGDSLSDNGNLFALTGNPPSPPYNRRFTNGFVFAEYLSGGPNSMFSPYQANLGPGSINLAIGGARNDNAANSNGPIPSTISQIATFGTLPVVAGGGFGPNDVVTYFAGANNIFQANVSNPATAQANVQAAAGGAGINTGTQVAGLAASGAKTILVFSLPNFGSTPSYSALGPQGVALGNFATLTYNAAAAQGVQAAAAANPGTNFIQIDTTSLIAGVIANPAAFGFTNVTASCVNTPACVGGTFAQQNQFLFWDSVHPTDAAHRILAAAVNDILYTPTNVANVAMLGEIGLWSRRSSMLEMFDKARMPGTKGDAVNYFVSIAGETRRRNTSLTAQQVVGGALVASNGRYYDYTMGGLRIGGFKNLGNGWTGGFAVSALTGEANAGKISASPTSMSFDASAGWRSGPMFVTGAFGAGVDRFSDYQRKTSVAAIILKGSTDAISASAAVEGGYDMAYGNVTVTPVARLGYLYTNVAAFSESGTIGSVNFGGRTVQGLTGAVELRAKAKISEMTSVNGMIGYETFLSRSAGAVNGQLANNTALPFATSVAAPVGAGLVFGTGIESVFGAWTAGLNYRGSIGQRSQTAHKGEVRLGYVW